MSRLRGLYRLGNTLAYDAGSDRAQLVARIEAKLMKNLYYRQAVQIGQLQPLGGKMVDAAALQALIEGLAWRGQTPLGDIKLPALFRLGEREAILHKGGALHRP